ncbi:MAG: glycoside hydrolase family 97 protein [Gemmatimonadaceae bacterium]|nr:glycoside hydrolase family 97 protein [Gemmatimonadaceae bacterium]NUQ94715.1 glycoside hydrolase family 97 protein [Gemmatimonadaceae bacterium]NUS96992.1 glycoside hydrolase family 97 protein [Gemmatimonadaceae bacterium]
MIFLRFPSFALALLAIAPALGAQGARTVTSPDGATTVRVETGDRVTWSVARRGRVLIAPSPISLTLDGGRVLGRGARLRGADTRQLRDSVRPVAPTKSAIVRGRWNELDLRFDGGYALEVRAYDAGVAWRWTLALGDSVTVVAEQATFDVRGATPGWVGLDSTFMTHYEPAYRLVALDTLRGGRLVLLPLLVPLEGGPKIAITESNLESYPGMYLVSGRDSSAGGPALKGIFPAFALADSARNDRDVVVTKRAPWLARIAGRRALPWRVVIIADEDRALLENQLVYELAPPSRLADVSWIRPGKVSWDWWNALNVRGVPFRAGVNTATYEYYIDFAARHGIPYIILDEGWYTLGDLLTQAPGVDVAEIARYGATKNVGVILWTTWHTLDTQMTPALDQFQRWGVKGIKVDFMQRDDQAVVDFYWRTAREAAARHLLVDFHGAHKPAGLNRAWPNVLTFEGVRGLEWNKWSEEVTPRHTMILPFTRMLAGPMDFTPGAMLNAQPRDFRVVFDRPMSMGTRARQLAMYVVYESPLQMLADSPSEYEREPDAMDFLSSVPVTWDETRALDAKLAEYAVVARRSGAAWFVGAMTDSSARTLPLSLSFLGDGRWTMDLWADGPNADRNGMDFTRSARTVTRADTLQLRLAPGGGFVARLRPASR